MLEIIIIIILFSLLVILHEFGHFIAARRNGVEVEEFGIGFPPYLWGRVVKGTLYSINWLPLGGFVRMKGEDDAGAGQPGFDQKIVVGVNEEPGTFGAAPYWAKFKILLAGVFMNLLTAVVILFVLCLVGMPALGAKFEPKFLHPQTTQKQLIITEVEPGSPAAAAGLKQGDFLMKAGSVSFAEPANLSDYTKSHAGQTVTFSVRSDGNERDVPVKLREANPKGILGVGSAQLYKLKYSPAEAVAAAVYVTGAIFWATILGVLKLLASIPMLVFGLFSSKIPEAAQAASGPVGIFFLLKQVSVLGYAYVFIIIANIAVALAAFNALPLPALDGGRLALITIQKLIKRKISAETEAKIHAYGFMALMALMVIITIYDVRKPH